ncbi:MAG: glycosyltransferase [Oscillospiraceae bacterium]|nr:glycosyltransferase [Oscillospiraceae bacterium]
MKKKLLFIQPSMQFGGAEKSLQTLLRLLDFDKYDVDLLLFRPEGEFLKLLPKEVNLLSLPADAQTFAQPIVSACLSFLKQGKASLALDRLRFSKAVRKDGSVRMREQYGWQYQKRAFGTLSENYDAAIAYLEGAPIYFCADCVRAKKKIAYIHNDYSKLQMDRSFDSAYFEKMDALVVVSEECAVSLRSNFPQYKEKVRVIENIIFPGILRTQADAQADFGDDFGGLRLLTVGRLDEQKGIDLGIQACAKLADKADFRWYVLGEGPEREKLEQMIRDNHLENRFILLGTRLNPYPYLRACDVYVQPSRFEGKSIALEEAKCLGKPILTTAFTTVADQITDGVNGSVAQIDSEDIARRLSELLFHGEIRQKYTQALQNYSGNTEELEKFYDLLI